MILIDTRISEFSRYIQSLSNKARKNFRYVQKHNADLTYSEVPYEADKMEWWMKLWEQQLIRGKRVTWAFGRGYLEESLREGKLVCFEAYKGDEAIAMHFVEKQNGYLECHPPIYDKEKYSRRYMAKYLWFELIKWAILQPDIDMIDFGGGGEPDWREMIIHRDKYPNPAYKWMYVPEEVKKHPEKQKRYYIENNTLHEWI
ncbi:MAG: GNAT family N-acetyltransferase [Candidatus Dadabacteria bacterium]|nr:GNAT family N-acetyltransferase [Candidatus Dadabacteria bacterium]